MPHADSQYGGKLCVDMRVVMLDMRILGLTGLNLIVLNLTVLTLTVITSQSLMHAGHSGNQRQHEEPAGAVNPPGGDCKPEGASHPTDS